MSDNGGDGGGGSSNLLSVKNIFYLVLFGVIIIAAISIVHVNRKVGSLLHNQRPYWEDVHFNPNAPSIPQ